MRIMITGGGTGGHTSPAVAILEELQKRDPRLEVQWVGCKNSIEERICRRLSIPFRPVPVKGWPRRRTLRKGWVLLALGWAVIRSAVYLRRFRPQVVLGVGGYVSVPLVWAAQRLGIPTVLHEQNRRLGMANRTLAAHAARLFLSYADTVGDFPRERAVVTGNPVRAGFAHPPDKDSARTQLGLDPSSPVVLICGGSQGAHSINAAVTDLLPMCRPDEMQLLWMTGAADAAKARQAAAGAPVRADIFTFIEDMATACAAADVVVSRAGASSTAELALLGRPSILIPYPHATDNHQEQNARAFEEAGASLLLRDEECTGQRLLDALRGLLGNRAKLQAMGAAAFSLAKPAAAEVIAEQTLTLVFEKPLAHDGNH